MKLLLLLFALCAFTAAMVPRERRALNTEEEPRSTTAKTTTKPPICAPTTPCGWAFYKPYNKIIESTTRNTYCECLDGYTCQIDEDDFSANSYIKRCRPGSPEPEETLTETIPES